MKTSSPSPSSFSELPFHQQAIRARCVHPSGTFIEFRKEEIEQSIPERFAQQVAKYPDRLAIKTQRYSLTYSELNQQANRIAHAILAQRKRAEEPVVLLLEHDAPLIAAMLAGLKTGKICVPLDPSYPPARIASMFTDAQAELIVSNTPYLSLAQELAQNRCSVLTIDSLDTHFSPANLSLPLLPDRPAYIHYTSGSTGTPKGVVRNHRAVLHQIMAYTNDVHLCAADRLSLLHSCSFGASLRQTLGALLNGAALFPYDLRTEGLVNLAPWLMQEQITVCHVPASVFRHFASLLSGGEKFPALRLLYVANEPVSKREVELYKAHFSPACLFVNALVASETSTIRQFFIDKETHIEKDYLVPVGYAVQDKDILLLDEEGKVLGVNQIGEITVKSQYLASGYWRKPDLTQATFLSDPIDKSKRIYRTGDLGLFLPDGCLVHVGRKDFQVKIRGQRIEIAEIEMALLNHTAIKEAVILARETKAGEQHLIAYIAANQELRPSTSELRRFLQERFPPAMIPTVFVILDALPRTPNGKIDREALPEPHWDRPPLDTPYVAPRTPLEETLAAIWAEALGLDQVGIHDHFLELGGNSLLATRVISRIIHTFLVNLPVRDLFESSTVADMALVITQHQALLTGQEGIVRMLAELEALSEEQVRQFLTDDPLIT